MLMKVMCMLQRRLDFLKGVVQIASCRYRSKINHLICLPLHYPKKKKRLMLTTIHSTQLQMLKLHILLLLYFCQVSRPSMPFHFQSKRKKWQITVMKWMKCWGHLYNCKESSDSGDSFVITYDFDSCTG